MNSIDFCLWLVFLGIQYILDDTIGGCRNCSLQKTDTFRALPFFSVRSRGDHHVATETSLLLKFDGQIEMQTNHIPFDLKLDKMSFFPVGVGSWYYNQLNTFSTGNWSLFPSSSSHTHREQPPLYVATRRKQCLPSRPPPPLPSG